MPTPETDTLTDNAVLRPQQ